MDLIFYDEAAQILDVTFDTLAHAVSRGELTRAGIQGNRRQLIKEQVMLYAGINPRTGNKKRMSYDGLSEQEQALWHRYANEAGKGQAMPAAVIDEDAIARIVRQQLLQQEREEAERKAIEAREREERYHKDYPFLYRKSPIAV